MPPQRVRYPRTVPVDNKLPRSRLRCRPGQQPSQLASISRGVNLDHATRAIATSSEGPAPRAVELLHAARRSRRQTQSSSWRPGFRLTGDAASHLTRPAVRSLGRKPSGRRSRRHQLSPSIWSVSSKAIGVAKISWYDCANGARVDHQERAYPMTARFVRSFGALWQHAVSG
jgi:hypothetical protein